MFFPFVPLYSAGLRAPTRTHPARSRSLALRLRLPCVAGPEPAADGKERSEGANGGAGWGIHPLKACHSHYVHPFLSSRYFFFICVVFFPPPPSDVSPVQRCRCSRGCGAVAGCGARCCGVRSVGEARGRALRGWMGCSQRCVSCRRFRSVVLNPDRALGSVPRQPTSPSFPPTPPHLLLAPRPLPDGHNGRTSRCGSPLAAIFSILSGGGKIWRIPGWARAWGEVAGRET